MLIVNCTRDCEKKQSHTYMNTLQYFQDEFLAKGTLFIVFIFYY